jgi:threonine/homoserine/homoserine lactone efflux protein
MGAAVGDILGLAAGVAVSPLPIVAMILLLATPHGRVTGSLFAVGWLVGLAVLGAIVLALAGPAGASSGGEPAAEAEPEMPRWMAGLDRMRPSGALGLGALLSAVNPKNGGLTIAAAASIAGAGLAGGSQAVVLAVFVLIGSLGVLAPLVVYFVGGDNAARTLETWRTWAADHNAAVMAVLFVIFGFKLVGDGIAVLS